MKKVKIFRRAAVVISALALCLGLTGCKVEFGTNPNARDKETAARPTAGDDAKGMDVSYGEFRKKYLYLLEMYEVEEDDENAALAEALRDERDELIHNMIQSKIVMRKARDYGVSGLTDEELRETRELTDTQIQSQIDYFADQADYSDLDPSAVTDEIRKERGGELFDELLERCDLTREDMFIWNKEYVISSKVLSEAVSDITREDAELRRDELIDKVKDMYKDDPELYENSGYSDLWLPEGSRLIKHVLLGFDEALQTQIMIYRYNGDSEGADQLRAEGEEALKEQVEEVKQKLEEMLAGKITFDDIIREYSADAQGSAAYPDGYIVIPNGSSYMKEFQEAAFIPGRKGDMATCITDYGIHFILYAGDATVPEENIESFTNSCFNQLRQQKMESLLTEWEEEYNYEIDRELLRLDIGTSAAGDGGTESGEAPGDAS